MLTGGTDSHSTGLLADSTEVTSQSRGNCIWTPKTGAYRGSMVTLLRNSKPARSTSTRVATDACNVRRRGITRNGNWKFSSQNANANVASFAAEVVSAETSDKRSGLMPAKVPASTRNDGDECTNTCPTWDAAWSTLTVGTFHSIAKGTGASPNNRTARRPRTGLRKVSVTAAVPSASSRIVHRANCGASTSATSTESGN